ncbi:kinase-like protein [Zopfia rhizophila CBS 207.26]|uniref:non-specific serine/threonine protein kinase n=1 Tax=Zopfia rhizophila CBS 207.26 TaxID=1314779 RepID=A0A6A6EX47_9PEZI|nr:kinase-like protein [Zopfia rhizophila CBS 207.26]
MGNLVERRLGGGSFNKTGQEVALKLEYECEFRVMAFQLLGPNLENLLNYCGRKFSLKIHIHSKEYVHRDVKPENMLIEDNKQGNNVYVTDIGLVKEIREPGEHNYSLIGMTCYASINAHLGSPRDDMESLGYILIYFLRGSLPWQGLKAETQEYKEKLILERKQSATDWGLYKDIPKEFKKSYKYDHVFDWIKLKFLDYLERNKGPDDG